MTPVAIESNYHRHSVTATAAARLYTLHKTQDDQVTHPLRTWFRSITHLLKQSRRLIKRNIEMLPLFRTVVLWVLLALGAFTLLGRLWGEGGWLTNWRSAGAGSTPLYVVRVSLTTIGGIGGTGYLVIKYRERASAERVEAEQKLLSAVQQLGSESPQVRIAGIYALADVADTYKCAYRQRVVDILCGYLRTQRGTGEVVTDNQNVDHFPAQKQDYMSNDGAVESTILNVLGRHLRKRRKVSEPRQAVRQDVEDDQLWCDCTFDLRGAVIHEPIDFSGATFDADVHAQGAHILADADFRNVNFSSKVDFSGAKFRGYADFRRATFGGSVEFQQTRFASVADFQDSIFERGCSFNKASIGKAAFNRAKFHGTTYFNRTQFEEVADYTQSEFTVVEFRNSKFSNGTRFHHTKFRQHVDFKDARFSGDTEVNFDGAAVHSASFEGAHFESSTPSFECAEFNEIYKDEAESVFIFFPSMTVNEDTGLPPGAAWAPFGNDGVSSEAPPTGQRTGTDTPGGEADPVS